MDNLVGHIAVATVSHSSISNNLNNAEQCFYHLTKFNQL